MMSLKRFFVNEPMQSQVLISIAVVLITLCCATTSYAKSEADLKTLMDEGVGKVLGVAPVELVGKLATTWSTLKTR